MSVLQPNVSQSVGGEGLALGRLLQAGLIGGIVAAVGSLLVYAIGRAVGVPYLVPGADGVTLEALPVIAIPLATILPALLAAGFLWGLARFVSQPVRIFTIISVIFLLLSFAPLLTMPSDLGTRIGLGLMHVIAGVAIIGALTRTRRA